MDNISDFEQSLLDVRIKADDENRELEAKIIQLQEEIDVLQNKLARNRGMIQRLDYILFGNDEIAATSEEDKEQPIASSKSKIRLYTISAAIEDALRASKPHALSPQGIHKALKKKHHMHISMSSLYGHLSTMNKNGNIRRIERGLYCYSAVPFIS